MYLLTVEKMARRTITRKQCCRLLHRQKSEYVEFPHVWHYNMHSHACPGVSTCVHMCSCVSAIAALLRPAAVQDRTDGERRTHGGPGPGHRHVERPAVFGPWPPPAALLRQRRPADHQAGVRSVSRARGPATLGKHRLSQPRSQPQYR